MSAYPLDWPAGLARTNVRRRSEFAQRTVVEAAAHLLAEVKRMAGGASVVLSMNVSLRLDGVPHANQSAPSDPGVAVYFQRRGKAMTFACDQWDRVQDNMRAIAKTIEALRGIERWGSADLMERAVSGFESLPAPEQWWQVLGVTSAAAPAEIDAAYRALAKAAHSDIGGSDAAMSRLNIARDQARAK